MLTNWTSTSLSFFSHSKTRHNRHFYCITYSYYFSIKSWAHRHTGIVSGKMSFAAPFWSGCCNGVVSSGAVIVTGIGLGGTLISIWSSERESILQRVSLDGERTEGKRPAVKRSETEKGKIKF